MTTITAYFADDDKRCPWRVLVNGKTDPVNRVFENVADIEDTYAALKVAGLIGEYQITILRD